MPGDPVGWTSLIAYGVQEPFVSFPVLFVADLQNDRSAEPLDTLPAAGLGAAARAASPLIPPLSADIAESGTTTFLVPHTEHRSFAFDVVFRSFLGITVGLLIGLSLSGVHLKGRQVLLVQFVPALHVLGIYIWQIKDKVMRERKGITRCGLLFGLIYGLLLPSLAKTWF